VLATQCGGGRREEEEEEEEEEGLYFFITHLTPHKREPLPFSGGGAESL